MSLLSSSYELPVITISNDAFEILLHAVNAPGRPTPALKSLMQLNSTEWPIPHSSFDGLMD